MPVLATIPEEYTEGFVELFSLNDSAFNSIFKSLSNTQFTKSIDKLASLVLPKGMEQNKIEEIFYSVSSLTFFLEKGLSSEEVVDIICSTLEYKKPAIKKDKQRLRTRLLQLLNNQQMFYASKAHDLSTEYSNVFLQARVITDIRPIFNLHIEDRPSAGVIVHNLHLHYKGDEEGGHKDIFIALDSDNIKNLKEALIRAEKKEVGLNKLFEQSKIIHLKE
jgi:hypothetical protein